MRLVERFSIIVFSIIVMILAGITILVSSELISIDIFENIFDILSSNIGLTICIGILFILWSIANIFFKSDSKYENSNGILLENENGSLLITKDSISNLVESVLRKTDDIKEQNVKIDFDSNKDVIINVSAVVKDTIIKDISTKIQENVKMTIKKATDLEVKEVNIKVKNVDQEKKLAHRKEWKVKMEKFLQFISEYRYPIIGFLIALLIIITGLYKLIIPIALIVCGIYFGLYFQKNKDELKEKIKNFVDKL